MSAAPRPAIRNTPALEPAFNRAVSHTKAVLLPFDIGKWLMLAVAAWLINFGQGNGFGGNFSFPGGPGGRPGSFGEAMLQVGQWINDHWQMILGVGTLAAAFLIVISLALAWVSARASFAFLAMVVENHSMFGHAWSHYGRRADSYFVFRAIVLVVFAMMAGLLLVGAGLSLAMLARADASPGDATHQTIVLAVVTLCIIIPFSIVVGLAVFLTEDLVLPVMAKQNVLLLEGARRVWGVAREFPGPFALYLIVRLAVGFCASLLVMLVTTLACCLTCCILALPVVNMLPVLPILVFVRLLSVAWLGQIGPEWQWLPDPVPAVHRDGPPPIPTQF